MQVFIGWQGSLPDWWCYVICVDKLLVSFVRCAREKQHQLLRMPFVCCMEIRETPVLTCRLATWCKVTTSRDMSCITKCILCCPSRRVEAGLKHYLGIISCLKWTPRDVQWDILWKINVCILYYTLGRIPNRDYAVSLSSNSCCSKRLLLPCIPIFFLPGPHPILLGLMPKTLHSFPSPTSNRNSKALSIIKTLPFLPNCYSNYKKLQQHILSILLSF